MSQDLKIGDLVSLAFKNNMYAGSIIANVATGPNGSHNFRVQSENVKVHGAHRRVKAFCVDYPASALTLIRVDDL